MTATASLRLEQLLGRRLIDAAGREVGCIEDVVAEPTGDEYLVTHVVIGSSNRLARLMNFAHQIPTLRALGLGRPPRTRRVPWAWLDLSDPMHPRLIPSVVDRD
jgi:sporulation protein YlmC with PRC-barrel domain